MVHQQSCTSPSRLDTSASQLLGPKRALAEHRYNSYGEMVNAAALANPHYSPHWSPHPTLTHWQPQDPQRVRQRHICAQATCPKHHLWWITQPQHAAVL